VKVIASQGGAATTALPKCKTPSLPTNFYETSGVQKQNNNLASTNLAGTPRSPRTSARRVLVFPKKDSTINSRRMLIIAIRFSAI